MASQEGKNGVDSNTANSEKENSYKADRSGQKQQEDDSSKKAAGVAAKGAINYATGGAGGKYYDAAKKIPGVGKKLDKAEEKLGKGLNKATGGKFGKVAKKLDDSGALDAADKALSLNAANGNGPKGASGNTNGSEGNKESLSGNAGGNKGGSGLPKFPGLGGKKDKSDSQDNEEQNDSSDKNTKDTDIIGKVFGSSSFLSLKTKIIIGVVLFVFIIFLGLMTSILNEDEANGETKEDNVCVSNEQILNIALGEVGNNEADGTHAKYLAMFGYSSGTAWCAAFVSWCANEAGIDQSIIPHTAAVREFLAYFQKSGTFHELSSNYSPTPGDLIIWQAHGRSHIGIVKEYNDTTGVLTTVEGNSSNAVRINTYQYANLESQGVVGFASQECTDNTSTGSTITGQVINIPNFKQTYATVTCYDYWCKSGREMVWTSGTSQRKISDLWKSKGSKFEDGLAVINVNGTNRYLVAVSNTFGSVGEQVDFYLSDGTVLPCIIADAKSPNDSNFTKYGHKQSDGSINIIEYQVKRSYYKKYGNPGNNGWRSNLNQNVVKAVNGGSILK